MSTREQIVAAGDRRGEDYFQPGARTAVEHSLCRKCGANVLTGLDSDVAGIPVVTEVHPLDLMGECYATMANRPTYAHVMRGRKMVLRGPRSAGQITLNPASTVRVVAEHACGQPLGRPAPPPKPVELTFLDTGPLPPCSMCGLPCVTNPCSMCRRAAEPARPIALERSETNEADQEAHDG